MEERLYQPSWVDRLTEAINRLPVPARLFYLGLAIPLVASFLLVQYWQGAYRDLGFLGWHIFIPIQLLFGIGSIHYIDQLAERALVKFRPVMIAGDQLFEQARFRLVNMPARPALLAGLAGAVFAAVQILIAPDPIARANVNRIAATPLSILYSDVNITLVWIGYGSLIYHSIHQLRVIDWLYTSRANIDPLNPEPLYALSEVTSQTAIVLLFIGYGWFMAITGGSFEQLPDDVMFYVTYVVLVAIDLLIFVLPLWGAHQLLVDAKNEALAANAVAYKAAVRALHRAVLGKDLDEIDVWNKGLAALDLERRHLKQLATWPWSPGALRNLMAAVFIPLLIWIAQFLLEGFLK